jgi:hypothetical protein
VPNEKARNLCLAQSLFADKVSESQVLAKTWRMREM